MQDIHAHTWDQEAHFSTRAVREADRSRGYPLDLTVDYDTFMADCAPFDKVAVFGLKARRSGIWVPDAYVDAFCARHDKLHGFAACDPTQEGDVAACIAALKDMDLVGVKMAPMYAGFDPRDPLCAPLYAYCQEHGVPILFHTGTTFIGVAPLEYSRPWIYDRVAIDYPDLHMVLAHLSHPYGEECLAVIRKHPHVYADVAAIYYRPWQFYNVMIVAQEYGVTDKLLFGTDYPFTTGEESIQGLRGVNDIVGDSGLPRVSSEVIEGILARDAFALLDID